MGTVTISTSRGDFTFQAADDAIGFLRTTPQDNHDIWISQAQPYPCLAVCIHGDYAAVHFFPNDAGEIWLSYNDKNQKEVSFMAGGSEWKPDATAVIALNDAFLCIREFLTTQERPVCIQWQEL